MGDIRNRFGSVNGPPDENLPQGSWVKVWRQVFYHRVVGIATGRTGHWLDLVSMAAFNGPERGTLIASRRFLAERWKWSEKAVRCFLKRLETEGMILPQNGAQGGANRGSRISICKYDEYQGSGANPSVEMGPKVKKKNKRKITSPRGEASPGGDASAFFEAYNSLAAKAGIASGADAPDRRKALRDRLSEHGQDSWRLLLTNIEASAFLQGRGERGRKSFGIDWFLKKANYRKVIEGTYGNGAHASTESQAERFARYAKELNLGDQDHE